MEKTMSKFEVISKKWQYKDGKSELVDHKAIGTFDSYFNAKLFADAYNKYYKAHAEIVEYKRA